MLFYNRATNKSTTYAPAIGGIYGKISFRRLCEILEECGEIKPNERITHLQIDNNGIGWCMSWD